ncbi:MAG: AraC family transcriptional regulator [Acidobacteriaceae bacterium]|nr:AraC family transcriptional regulator [Acidobacteriaceae bacterium]
MSNTEAAKQLVLDPPQIVETPALQAAVIRFTIPREEIRSVMGPGMQELIATVTAQGITPTGRIFSHHFKMDPAVFDFEIGISVPTPVTPASRVQPGQLAARKVIRTVYHGSYEHLGAAWGQFEAWIAANGLSIAPDLWESYLTGPDMNPDPATWTTELNRPLAG